MKLDDPQLQGMIAQLVDTLREELRQNQRLLRIVRHKKESLQRNLPLEDLLRAEREVVSDAVTIERDRIALLTELGQVLGHDHPARLRVAEVILYSNPENRDELLDLRDELRDVADEIDDLGSVEPLFTRHRQDRIRLYVSPSRWKGLDCASEKPAERNVKNTAATKGQERA